MSPGQEHGGRESLPIDPMHRPDRASLSQTAGVTRLLDRVLVCRIQFQSRYRQVIGVVRQNRLVVTIEDLLDNKEVVPVQRLGPESHDRPACQIIVGQQARVTMADALDIPIDHGLGRTPDAHTDQLASAAVLQARADGLQRIDQMALSTDGQRLWGVQTPPGRTDHLFDLRTSVPTTEAMTPMHQSGAQWPQAMQQFEQAQVQQQAQSQQATQQQAQSQGPVMSHGGHGM